MWVPPQKCKNQAWTSTCADLIHSATIQDRERLGNVFFFQKRTIYSNGQHRNPEEETQLDYSQAVNTDSTNSLKSDH